MSRHIKPADASPTSASCPVAPLIDRLDALNRAYEHQENIEWNARQSADGGAELRAGGLRKLVYREIMLLRGVAVRTKASSARAALLQIVFVKDAANRLLELRPDDREAETLMLEIESGLHSIFDIVTVLSGETLPNGLCDVWMADHLDPHRQITDAIAEAGGT